MYVQGDLSILCVCEQCVSSLLLGARCISFDLDGSVDDNASFEMIYETNGKVHKDRMNAELQTLCSYI
jgi:hypothetical protein